MAYKRNFNPDALPPHAQPDEAAQQLSQGQGSWQPGQKPNSARPTQSPNGQPRPPPKPSPPQGYRPQAQQPHQNHSNHVHSPQLQGTAWGTRPNVRPPVQQQQQPPQHSASMQPHQSSASPYGYAPQTPVPPGPGSGDLYSWFVAANTSKSGALTRAELENALMNADATHFDPLTIKSLVKMFSSSPVGQPQGPTITYPEFQHLWKFLTAWRELFERFDEDHSGHISLDEFSNALAAFGYRLTAPFVATLYSTYGGHGGERRPSMGTRKGMGFDLFLQACLSLKRMTDVFKGYDDDRDGYISLSFEEFLIEMIRMRE